MVALAVIIKECLFHFLFACMSLPLLLPFYYIILYYIILYYIMCLFVLYLHASTSVTPTEKAIAGHSQIFLGTKKYQQPLHCPL